MDKLIIIFIILLSSLLIYTLIPNTWYPNKLVTFKRKCKYPNKFSIIPKVSIDTVYEKVFEKEDISHLNTNMITIDDYIIDIENEPQKTSRPLESVISDSQNVHDSYIQSGLSHNYTETPDDFTDIQKMNTIIEYSGEDPIIEKMVCKIKKRNVEMTKYNGSTEFDILWNTFNSGCENVKNQILLILRQFSLSEFLPCSTGVASQIREASFINCPEKMPIHQALLQQHLLAKASVLNREENMNFETVKSKLISEYSDIYPVKDLEKIISEWGEF